jgi:hypothetical protein
MDAAAMGKTQRGQATVDYVAVVAIVAVVLAVGAAAISVTGVGDRILYAMRKGICTVGGVLCPLPPQPCVVSRDAQRDTGSVTVWFVRVGEDQALLVERRSDGKVAVTLAGGGHAGGELGIGAGGEIEAGGKSFGAGGEARAAAVARLGGGQEWILPSEGAAKRLIEKLGQGETIPLLDTPAHVIDDLFGGGDDIPRPDVEWGEAGTGGDASAEGDAGPATVTASVAMRVAEGMRTDHTTGRKTVYLKLNSQGSVSLAKKLLGVGGASDASASVALTFDRHGRPVELAATGWGQLEAGVHLPAARRFVEKLLAHSKGHGSGGGRLEVDARLDLIAPANAEAAKRLVDALGHPTDPGGIAGAIAGLGERFVNGARLDARLYEVTSDTVGGGGRVKVGVGVGGNVEHRVEQHRLVGAWARPPDGAWGDRRDCLDAARRLAA